MNKTVSSVIDDINEWENPRGGSVFYVTAMFTDESVGSVGRKDHDAALEVQGLLREAIGVELDFTLEASGQTKTGREKFKILGFGTPGGAATYTAPGVQGEGLHKAVGQRRSSPEPSSEQAFRTPADFRAEKALEAAVDFLRPVGTGAMSDINAVLEYADAFNAWMLEKTSEPASSAYDSPSTDLTSAVNNQAGAGSETTSGGAGVAQSLETVSSPKNTSGETSIPPDPTSPAGETVGAASPPAGDDRVIEKNIIGDNRGGQGLGEGSCPPHDLDLDVAPKAMRYPCRKCSFWVKPTMAAEEAEEAAK